MCQSKLFLCWNWKVCNNHSIINVLFSSLFIINYYLFIIVPVLAQPEQYVGLIKMNSPPKQLRKMNIFEHDISLSGYSSGAGFAQQLQLSYSSLFSGIAMFSQTFYRCGPGDGIQASFDQFCTKLGNLEHEWDPRLALNDMIDYHVHGLIENPRHLKYKKLYLYVSTKNWLYTVEQQLRNLDIYKPFIWNNKYNIRTQLWGSNHTLPSNMYGGHCEDSDAKGYFIGNCGLNGAYEALRFIHGKWAVSYLPHVHSNIILEPLHSFNQTDFFYGYEGHEHLMDKIGFFYVPSKCKKTKCLLHFYFHGCRSGREFLGDHHIRYSGFLQVAELNNIIMIFPQATTNAENAIGCWDTYGLTGKLFATKKGVQVTIVRNMLARILGEDQVIHTYYKNGYSGGPSKLFPFMPKLELIFPSNVKMTKKVSKIG